jgi:hypothetical protein
MDGEVNHRNVLPNGMTLLQTNPSCAADLRTDSKWYGWLFTKHPDGQWVSLRKLGQQEMDQAWDQSVDGFVMHGTKVREG